MLKFLSKAKEPVSDFGPSSPGQSGLPPVIKLIYGEMLPPNAVYIGPIENWVINGKNVTSSTLSLSNSTKILFKRGDKMYAVCTISKEGRITDLTVTEAAVSHLRIYPERR